jgi:hypothetical protein
MATDRAISAKICDHSVPDSSVSHITVIRKHFYAKNHLPQWPLLYRDHRKKGANPSKFANFTKLLISLDWIKIFQFRLHHRKGDKNAHLLNAISFKLVKYLRRYSRKTSEISAERSIVNNNAIYFIFDLIIELGKTFLMAQSELKSINWSRSYERSKFFPPKILKCQLQII